MPDLGPTEFSAEAAVDIGEHKNGSSEPVANWKVCGKRPSHTNYMENMNMSVQGSGHPFQINC